MSFNNLLVRQLKRAGLEADQLPDDITKWHTLLEFINSNYETTDQDRYLIERSLEISSREMLELNDVLEKDIAHQKKVENEIRQLNEKIGVTARRAGMAEIATAVLHNIGNVLNSANVSITMLKEIIHGLHPHHFEKVVQLIQTHQSDLANYFNHDAKGKLLPSYLMTLSKEIDTQIKTMSHEINNLTDNISHIKDIIVAQQSISGNKTIEEKISLKNALKTVLQISGNSFNSNGIKLTQNLQENFILMTDKSKLFQILVNLIQNARESVIDSKKEERIINIACKKIDDNKLSIEVKDNGLGIPKENLTKIFSFGFTSKKKGHGFGLHSSAIAAKELGGTLFAESEGIGQGAVFKLTIPFTPSQGSLSHD